jgi:hypothetical protein
VPVHWPEPPELLNDKGLTDACAAAADNDCTTHTFVGRKIMLLNAFSLSLISIVLVSLVLA